MDDIKTGSWSLFFATGLPQAYLMAKEVTPNATDMGETGDVPYSESTGITGCEL